MSPSTADGEQFGPVQVSARPPLDAIATVSVETSPLTTLGVPSGTTVAIHDEPDEQGPGVEDYEYTADVPEPAGKGVDGDPHDSFATARHSWVTITVDGERRGRFTAAPGETVSLHLEPSKGDIQTGGTVVSGDNPEGSTAEDGGSA